MLGQYSTHVRDRIKTEVEYVKCIRDDAQNFGNIIV